MLAAGGLMALWTLPGGAQCALRRAVRVRVAEAVMATAFVLVAVGLVLASDSSRQVSWLVVAMLVGAYAVAALVEFEVGAGAAVPTQLVLIPMLFVLPTGWVPLAAAAGFVLSGLVCRALPLRACGNPLLLIGSSWYAVGPTLVLLVAGEAAPAWSRWPVYLLAFAAQFAFDLLSVVVAGVLTDGTLPALAMRVMGSVYLIDLLLAPVAFAIAGLAVGTPLVVVAIVPLLLLLALFARDRRARIDGLRELGEIYRGSAEVLGGVIEADDAYTGDHSRGVQDLCLAIADAIGLDSVARREVEFTALLHDVGKLRIPNDIITKPGKLTADERAVIETHTIEGERLLGQAGGYLAHIGGLVRSCHERYDGAGYPDRIAGEDIPLTARIVACCDAYDAMTTDRPYRDGMPREVAIGELRACSGAQFCPEVVDALCMVLGAPGFRGSELGSGVKAAEASAALLREPIAAPAIGPVAATIDRAADPAVRGAVVEQARIADLRARARVSPALSAYAPGALFTLAAAALPFLFATDLSLRTAGLLVALIAGYALAFGIEFKVGAGSAIPTQLAFVPMLVLLPATLVPLAVGAAILARAGWDPNTCNCPTRQRPFVLLAGGLYTLAPVTILLTTGGTLTFPLLAAALLAQVVVDATINVLRVSVTLGYPITSLAKSLAWTYLADAALTPAALVIAAPETTNAILAAAAVTGLLGFLTLVASDRQRHLKQVTSLADAYRDAADRARRDALTGLTNRLGWDEALAGITTNQPAAVLLLDVNNLKAANDTRGHQFGDRVLAEIARTILTTLPHADLVARLSGDEFGILLLDDNAATDDYSAYRLRKAFTDHPGLDGHPVAAAIGHAQREPGGSFAAALELADAAVYADKPAAQLSRLTSAGRTKGHPMRAITGAYAATPNGTLTRLPRIINGTPDSTNHDSDPRAAPPPQLRRGASRH